MELIGLVYRFDWGKIGNDSLVAQLAALNNPGFKLQANLPYAQLCVGSYPGDIAIYKESGEALSTELPFILKVLSMNKAISLHVHPNKTNAEYLHLREPKFYKDSWHKPEMAIALTPFVAVCGFRPLSEIKNMLMDIYPLKKFVMADSDDIDLLDAGDEQGLRNCYQRIFDRDLEAVAQCVEEISKDFGKEMCKFDVLEIFNVLKRDFPRDIGVILIFFLNVIRLEPGQAMFADAGQIHSYLAGDCIECMTPSDNAIRAGLTIKYRDTKHLSNILNYKSSTAEDIIVKPERINDQQVIFKPPIEDFAVTQITLRPEDDVYVLQIEQSPGIMLVLSGQRTLEVNGVKQTQLKRGSILFLPFEAGTELRFLASGDEKESFVAYISTANTPPNPTTDT
ncbi:mannose-6-phosphate isomerase-like [Bactrocera tryoni]|uniref:mannose-6-phosphate isomerase-like n=1 Tax=Bactrocera tryoni TaxID=59916 RepID=UPI001A993FEB|nr:mannose-6-phosphate isomerase-like [Bactrocera tryoni]